MKRIIAMGLVLALSCGLFITAAFADEVGAPQEQPAAEQTVQAEQTPPAEEAPSAGEEQTAEEAPNGENAPETPDVPEPDALGTASYANLESRVRENNLTVLSLEETIGSIECIDLKKVQSDTLDLINSMASLAFKNLTMNDAEFDDYLGMISAFTDIDIDRKTFDVMMANREALRQTYDDLKSGRRQRTNDGIVMQLRNAQNQVVMGAESLYVALLEMDNTRGELTSQLAALDRTVQEMELRYAMGQISALTLQQVKSGRAALASGLATLEVNIGTYTAQLENLLGAEITGALKLSEVPEITDGQIAAMDMEKDLETSRANSYELYNAAMTLDDAEEAWEDVKDQYKAKNQMRISGQHTWQAAQYTYEATVQGYELRFRTVYNAVADYRQILTAQEAALELQRDTYAAQELKYQQGTISQNALLEARDTLAAAENDVTTAKHNLFTAYRAYRWAVDFGVLN